MSSRFSSQRKAKNFIRKDLKDVLKWLLVSTALWEYYKNIDNNHGDEVSMAMHTNAISTRALFEFFTKKPQSNGSGNDAYITDLGIPKPYISKLYIQGRKRRKWREAINRHIGHISVGRSKPTNIKSGRHLNTMMSEFRDEIMRLWDKLENDPKLPSGYRDELIKARLAAENDRATALARFNADKTV
jgi:hypothetical protein